LTKDIVNKRIPIRKWDELDRKNAIVARMVADRVASTKWRGEEELGSDSSH
jgi:hypothetical protein